MEKKNEGEDWKMLKQLMLTRKIKELRSQLEALRAKDADFETRKQEIKKREEELEAAINEITDETPDEEKAAVEESVEEFENDQKALEDEEEENEGQKKKLEDEISELQKELDEINSRLADSQKQQKRTAGDSEERKDEKYMRNRNIFGEGLKEIVVREDVKGFLERTRGLIGQKRAVIGADLTIPEIMLDLLRDNLHRYSKLISKIRLKPVAGKARQNIAGTIPEGVWTEAVGSLNELTFGFNQIEVDGYKVGGFIPIPNSTLEDSDLNLANEIMDALGQALGLAIDKAILYGTGTKMPVGIATRLAETAEPAYWGTDAPDWTDLSDTNIISIDTTDLVAEEFFAELILKFGVAEPNYSDGKTFWAMNRKTKMKVLSNAITINAAGAIVAGMNNTMPIEGGDIVELDFIPDNDIIGGFGSLYLLAERAGANLAVSEHVRFIEDQTVFKGTARYDGKPARGEGFVIINIANEAPTTSLNFAADTAN